MPHVPVNFNHLLASGFTIANPDPTKSGIQLKEVAVIAPRKPVKSRPIYAPQTACLLWDVQYDYLLRFELAADQVAVKEIIQEMHDSVGNPEVSLGRGWLATNSGELVARLAASAVHFGIAFKLDYCATDYLAEDE